MAPRKASIKRNTKETSVSVTVNLDGSGKTSVKTGINFLDHLIVSLDKHGMMDLKVDAKSNDGIEHHHIYNNVYVDDKGRVKPNSVRFFCNPKTGDAVSLTEPLKVIVSP